MDKNFISVLRSVGAYCTWSGRPPTLGEAHKLSSCSRSTTWRQLKKLEEIGFIERMLYKNKPTRYRWTASGEAFYIAQIGEIV
jgi:DNA-binding IclR family transcriptional regulator